MPQGRAPASTRTTPPPSPLDRAAATTQRRAWRHNLCLVGLPIIFCMLLLVLQRLVNSELSSGEEFRCGCKCLACCDWVGPEGGCGGSVEWGRRKEGAEGVGVGVGNEARRMNQVFLVVVVCGRRIVHARGCNRLYRGAVGWGGGAVGGMGEEGGGSRTAGPHTYSHMRGAGRGHAG